MRTSVPRGSFGGHRDKFQGYEMGTTSIMEVNFGATIGYLHDPYRDISNTIWQTLSWAIRR